MNRRFLKVFFLLLSVGALQAGLVWHTTREASQAKDTLHLQQSATQSSAQKNKQTFMKPMATQPIDQKLFEATLRQISHPPY